MGCSSSSRVIPSLSSSAPTELMVPLDGIDWDKGCKVNVQEFSIYSQRLKEIDWVEHIIAREFRDPYFPTDINSLLDPSKPQEERHEKWRNFTWKRPVEIYGPNNYVIYDQPGPCDIVQGSCGDCYYLSSLSAIAEYPERIKKIFITKEVNEAGCYAVTMYINGEKRTVVVDDYFPYNNEK